LDYNFLGMNMESTSLTPRQKALQINLDPKTYGSFAEIGAGQEVAALFFKAGAASGTIAKTISAYDMTFSDAIYGTEESGRYVCESRLMKMLSREYTLLEKRLKGVRSPDTLFFAFANTLVALNYNKTNEGHGWLGMRFQLKPDSEPNDVIIHVRMLDNDSALQQQAIGIIGVNLVYGCFYFHNNPEQLLISLVDHLGRDRIEIDMMRVTGPDFKNVDNRLISLQLVKNRLTHAALFDPQGNVLQPSEVFYKKNILLLRGRFRPVTKVNTDMLKSGHEQFGNDSSVDLKNVIAVSELTLSNLRNDGEINEKDFLDRAELLCSLGQTVLISDYHEYYRLVAYLSRFTKQKIGIIIGILNLAEIFNEKYYLNLKGGILEAFATLFSRNVKMYVYPARDKVSHEYMTCSNFTLSPSLTDLYEYLIVNDKLEDIKDVRLEYLNIVSDRVLEMIKNKEDGWEIMVPELVANAIKEKKLFSYSPNF
jgi:hypothetical protein